MQKAFVLLGLLTVAGSAHAAARPLPPPAFTARAYLAALTASGPTTALATVERGRCVVRFLRLGTSAKPGLLRPPSPCGGPDSEAVIDDLWLGRSGIAAETYDSPSPHGEAFAYLAGPRPAGPLRMRGEWSWTDSQPPRGFGCAWAVAAGGGVIAAAATPHRLGWDHGMEQGSPSCPSRGSTIVELSGAPGARLVVPGVHAPLATDGKRVLLAELDENGARSGRVSLLDLAGKPLPAPRVDPALVKIAYAAWLTPDGLVIASKKGIRGVGWSAPRAGAATVGLGRVVYQVGRRLHVHRVKGGPDRLLLMLPRGRTLLAAGSTGVAIATDDDTAVRLYRLPWRTIDRTLTAMRLRAAAVFLAAEVADVLVGLGGDDRLFALDPAYVGDTLLGGPGDDVLSGGFRQDDLSGGPGEDKLYGGPSGDRLVGGRDRLSGQGGRDLIYAADGQRDRVICGTNLGRATPERDDAFVDRFDVVAPDCEYVNGRRR